MAPLSTRVTATLANASERHSIAFEYQQTPIYHKPVTVEVPLDEKGCLAVELPFTEAQMASVKLDKKVKLFLGTGRPIAHRRGLARPASVPPLFRPRRGQQPVPRCPAGPLPRLPRHRLQRLGG